MNLFFSFKSLHTDNTLQESTNQQKSHYSLTILPLKERHNLFVRSEMARPRPRPQHSGFSLFEQLIPLLLPILISFAILYAAGYVCFRLGRALLCKKPTLEEIRQRLEYERQHPSIPVWIEQAGQTCRRCHNKGEAAEANPSQNVRPPLKRRRTY